jgi:hypothetical protein
MADEALVAKLTRLITGKRTSDIELPSESDKVDPRIEKADGVSRAAEGYDALKKNPLFRGK